MKCICDGVWRAAFPKLHSPECSFRPRTAPEEQELKTRGSFRIYFNRHQAAPLVWCIAGEHFELAVAELVIDAPVTAVYQPKATPDDEDGRPSAWLEVSGALALEGKRAFITRAST